MNPRATDSAIRFIEALGHKVDRSLFRDADLWGFIGDLIAFARQGKPLPNPALIILREFGNTIGLKPGAHHSAYQPMLERELGPSPYGPEEMNVVVQYMHAQVNGASDFAPPKKPLVSF